MSAVIMVNLVALGSKIPQNTVGRFGKQDAPFVLFSIILLSDNSAPNIQIVGIIAPFLNLKSGLN